MQTADAIGARSRCDRAGVGAVIVTSDQRVVSASYNGPAADYAPSAGTETTCSSWCARSAALPGELHPMSHDCPALHAEANAVARASFEQSRGATVYVTGSVCWSCAKTLAAARVGRVVMRVNPGEEHRHPAAVVEYLEDCGIAVCVVRPEPSAPDGQRAQGFDYPLEETARRDSQARRRDSTEDQWPQRETPSQ